ncbi:hypothetical protein [Pedobacter sp. Leaf170]|uniref:hypothetical protein n=1 Tax=Pedobacter sp. Leaf170 TaxID=2876558 RepID=UPI001E4FBE83|nr:hypothetical protein [Pedobacter sp. Leaf170]
MADKKPLYKQSETVTIKRSQVNFAVYNPKNHTDAQKAQIKRNIKSVGFLGGVIWNKATGNLIDGHKRVQTLDSIHHYDGTTKTDYDLKVEMVELDLKTEKEQNIFQTKSRTELDNVLLGNMLDGIDYDLAGLDEFDLNMIAAESPAFDFGGNDEVKEDIKEMERPYEERKQMIKDMKAQQKENTINKFQGDPFFTLSFDSFENKAEFLERFGFNPSEKFIKGEIFADKL